MPPLTREQVNEWSTEALREVTAGVAWTVLDDMIATVRRADARADRLRAFLDDYFHAVRIGLQDVHGFGTESVLQDLLAADDADRKATS